MSECSPDKCNEIEQRLGKVEARVSNVENGLEGLRKEMTDSFREGHLSLMKLDTAIDNLAHDFGSRMNILHKEMVDEAALKNKRESEEKARWGETFRKVVWVVTITLLAIAGVATGATMIPKFLMMFK